jgi:hypothetical protein
MGLISVRRSQIGQTAHETVAAINQQFIAFDLAIGYAFSFQLGIE